MGRFSNLEDFERNPDESRPTTLDHALFLRLHQQVLLGQNSMKYEFFVADKCSNKEFKIHIDLLAPSSTARDQQWFGAFTCNSKHLGVKRGICYSGIDGSLYFQSDNKSTSIRQTGMSFFSVFRGDNTLNSYGDAGIAPKWAKSIVKANWMLSIHSKEGRKQLSELRKQFNAADHQELCEEVANDRLYKSRK